MNSPETLSLQIDTALVAALFKQRLPVKHAGTASQWCELHVVNPGSARKARFDLSVAPLLREPIDRWGDQVTRRVTLVKPIQAGGSAAGEACLCYTISTADGGDVQYNWENNDKAEKRWKKRIERILKATRPVAMRWPTDRNKVQIGLVNFAHLNLTVQGVFQDDNLDSDSIRWQINEELHGWEPGRLAMADGRLTAFWDAKQFNISNASMVGDQLHKAWLSGTMQLAEHRCPACGLFQFMHAAEYEDGRPGGLKYDGEKSKLADGSYDYNILEPTIFYECDNAACRHRIYDIPADRRALALTGRFGAPTNKSAHLKNRSYLFEAVAVDYIPWINLVMEKHQAIKFMRLGDIEPMIAYNQRRECKFWDAKKRPGAERIVLNSVRKESLPGAQLRTMFVDRQAGRASVGEVPHWWIVIRDWGHTEDPKDGKIKLFSRLIYEGKKILPEDVEELQRVHEVKPQFVGVDARHDTVAVYRLCARYGYTAFMGDGTESGRRKLYKHEIFDEDENEWFTYKRIFSAGEDVDAYQGDHQGRQGSQTALLVLFSKQGIRDMLHELRNSPDVVFEIPADVSEDYRNHWQAEELEEDEKTGLLVWKQKEPRNDLFVCDCGNTLIAHIAGVVGAPPKAEAEPDQTLIKAE